VTRLSGRTREVEYLDSFPQEPRLCASQIPDLPLCTHLYTRRHNMSAYRHQRLNTNRVICVKPCCEEGWVSVKRTYRPKLQIIVKHTYSTVADNRSCSPHCCLVTLVCTREAISPLYHCRHSAGDGQYERDHRISDKYFFLLLSEQHHTLIKAHAHLFTEL